MGKKIFGIYLAKLDAPNSEAHARLELPASPLELHDAMDKVQLQENEELYLEIDDYYGFEYLAPHLMELDASLNELNDLAGRLAVLDETEQEAFDGLLRLEIQRNVESNGGKKRLVDGTTALAEKRPRVIKIEPAERPQNVRLRVAAYTRVSSDSEDQLNSFAAQNRYYTELISGKAEWRMVDIYADEGITGTSVAKRDDFQRMMADCRRGLIDQVLVKSISRFARNTKDCLQNIRELKELGVNVRFEREGIDTQRPIQNQNQDCL